MNGVRYDEWQAFLERRQGPGWQLPLNLAVAMHLAVFGGALFLQNIERSTGFKAENVVTVNLVNMAELGLPAAPEAVVKPVPETALPVEPPAPLLEIRAPKARKTAVAKPAAPPIAAAKKEAVSEPVPVRKEAVPPEEVKPKPAQATAEVKPEQPAVKDVVEISPADAIKKIPALEAAAASAPKPEEVPAPVVKEVVSLNPLKVKEKAPVKPAEDKMKELKAAEAAQAAEAKRKQEKLARLAEVKQQEEQVRAAKLEEERKAAEARKKLEEEKRAKETAEAKRKQEEHIRLAEVKRQEEQARAAKLEKERKAAEVRKKLAEQERQKALDEAKRIEQEAELTRLEAVKAREQLVRALRENLAVSTAASSGSGRGSGSGTGSGHTNPAALNQYASALNAKISGHWKLPELVAANRNLKTVVALTVRRNGTIEDMKIERKSGDTFFDQSVMKSLRSAEPLPNFPALISDSKLEFALNFTPQGLTF